MDSNSNGSVIVSYQNRKSNNIQASNSHGIPHFQLNSDLYSTRKLGVKAKLKVEEQDISLRNFANGSKAPLQIPNLSCHQRFFS